MRLGVYDIVTGTGSGGLAQEDAALRELVLSHAVGREAEVPNPLEAMRRNMKHEAPQKFYGVQRPGAQPAPSLVVFPPEGYLAVLKGDETVVGDRHPMGVAGQVLEHILGLTDGFFDIDHPLLVAQGRKQTLPGLGLGELPTASLEGQLAPATNVFLPGVVT